MARNESGSTKLTVTDIIDVSKYDANNNIFNDNYTTSMPATIRGSDTYFLQYRCNLLGMISNIGNPHLFVSFSCSEETWPDLEAYLIQFGKAPKGEETIYTANPVLSNHYCYERLQAMFHL